ncbi:MAG: hypothetical protein MHM6MM_009241, partial [Cercozoa sp. M6MM]
GKVHRKNPGLGKLAFVVPKWVDLPKVKEESDYDSESATDWRPEFCTNGSEIEIAFSPHDHADADSSDDCKSDDLGAPDDSDCKGSNNSVRADGSRAADTDDGDDLDHNLQCCDDGDFESAHSNIEIVTDC